MTVIIVTSGSCSERSLGSRLELGKLRKFFQRKGLRKQPGLESSIARQRESCCQGYVRGDRGPGASLATLEFTDYRKPESSRSCAS